MFELHQYYKKTAHSTWCTEVRVHNVFLTTVSSGAFIIVNRRKILVLKTSQSFVGRFNLYENINLKTLI